MASSFQSGPPRPRGDEILFLPRRLYSRSAETRQACWEGRPWGSLTAPWPYRKKPSSQVHRKCPLARRSERPRKWEPDVVLIESPALRGESVDIRRVNVVDSIAIQLGPQASTQISKTLGLSAAERKGRATTRAAKNGVKRFIALQHLSGPYHFKIGNELFLL